MNMIQNVLHFLDDSLDCYKSERRKTLKDFVETNLSEVKLRYRLFWKIITRMNFSDIGSCVLILKKSLKASRSSRFILSNLQIFTPTFTIHHT